MKLRPTMFVIKFQLSGEIKPLHRVHCEHLTAGGIGIIYKKDNLNESIGSIELIGSQLIINDDSDEELLYVKDILSDIVY